MLTTEEVLLVVVREACAHVAAEQLFVSASNIAGIFHQAWPDACHTVCRFVLQPGMLPKVARLARDLLALRLKAAAFEAAGNTSQDADFADVVLVVGKHNFRWSALHLPVIVNSLV